MAKPIAVQKLKHGKALCGKTFGGFVDTFNWLVDFCQSLKGDNDANQGNGTITVDRADPSAPVIRGTNVQGGGGGDEEITVVVGMRYDMSEHKFIAVTRKILAKYSSAAQGGQQPIETEIFATTPHSQE